MPDKTIKLRYTDYSGEVNLKLLVYPEDSGSPVEANGYALTQSEGEMLQATIPDVLTGFYDVVVTDNALEPVSSFGVLYVKNDVAGTYIVNTKNTFLSVPVDSQEIANLVIAGLGGVTVQIVNPYNETTQLLTLVQRADYKTTSINGPLRFILDANVAEGDQIRFGAKNGRLPPIVRLGSVVTIGDDLVAEVELSKEDDTDRKASKDWRWELEHIDGDGNVTPFIVDQKLTILPSQADPIA